MRLYSCEGLKGSCPERTGSDRRESSCETVKDGVSGKVSRRRCSFGAVRPRRWRSLVFGQRAASVRPNPALH